MKRIVFCLLVVILFAGCIQKPAEEEEGPDPELLAEIERVHATPINDVNLSTIEDGVYGGSFGYYGIDYGVSVTVKDHKITNIEVIETEEEDPYAKTAEDVLPRVIEEQKITVDVTG
jgi:uncharacterized protein with FMN-binding domain